MPGRFSLFPSMSENKSSMPKVVNASESDTFALSGSFRECSAETPFAGASSRPLAASSQSGILVINADDWGRDRDTTDRTFECIRRGSVSSVSAMVFMEDSERAAATAREHKISAGLHLNFTTPFSTAGSPAQLNAHQHRLSRYLRRHRFSPVIFHPGLVRSFAYVVESQIDEYSRLYGTTPDHIDGHHHMHLCANVLFQKLLPFGTLVRRNFSFEPAKKASVTACTGASSIASCSAGTT